MHSQFFKNHVVATKPSYYRVSPGMSSVVDVWLEPAQVWEVLAADLSISPAHLAGVGLV
jgi:DNA ligase 1